MKGRIFAIFLLAFPWVVIADELIPCPKNVHLFVVELEYPVHEGPVINQGYVKLQFVIEETGIATNIKVVDAHSEPQEEFAAQFIESAISALEEKASYNPGDRCLKTYRFGFEIQE